MYFGCKYVMRVQKLNCYIFHNVSFSFMCFLRSSASFSTHFFSLSSSYPHLFLGSQSVAMKPNRKTRSSSSSSSTVTYTYQNVNSTLPQPTEIPIKSSDPPIPITVHFHDHSAAAARIQAAYRASVVRALVKKIASIEAEVNRLERLIQQQETVDAVRSSEKEKLRINEALMVQLLKLDSVPGVDLGVRELRRNVTRRIVALQEVMDGICGERAMDGWDGLWKDWDDEGFYGIEERVCRERGGDELEKFCAHSLGFRCFERFLREF